MDLDCKVDELCLLKQSELLKLRKRKRERRYRYNTKLMRELKEKVEIVASLRCLMIFFIKKTKEKKNKVRKQKSLLY